MKIFSFAALTLAFGASIFAQPVIDYRSPNEGLTFTHDPGDPEYPNPMPWRVDFWVNPGRFYYLEGTDDLVNGPWTCLQNQFFGGYVGNYKQPIRLSFTSSKYFVRVRYIEGRRAGYTLQEGVADNDHDGITDFYEIFGPPRSNPLEAFDIDADSLPDDWERRYFLTNPPPENGDGDPANDLGPLHLGPAGVINAYSTPPLTAYPSFKQDWVKGLCLEYGGQFFWYKGQSSAAPYVYNFTGDQYGSLRLTYTDADLSTLATVEVFPRTQVSTLVLNDPIQMQAQARALYTYVNDPDPALRGYTFTADAGYELIPIPETSNFTLGPPSTRPAPRDLLRSIDTMLWPVGASRPEGATQPMPLKRVLVASPGGPVARRIPAPLAITSLPVTQIGRDRFPVVIRDCSDLLPRYFQDFVENHIPSPGFRIVEQAALSKYIVNPVQRQLDADGLPQGVDIPDSCFEIYPSSGPSDWNRLMFRNPLSFSRWYRDNSAQGYVLPGIRTAYPDGFTLPGSTRKYFYGLYSGDTGFYPHRDDVAEPGKFTTELHGRLNYDSDTRLYLASNDDCWVFINGKLVDDLDLGGIPPDNAYANSILFSTIRSSLGLTAESGTCRIDVFHADRESNWSQDPVSFFPAQLRILSTSHTSPLVPIYCYQVVAESATAGPLNYEFTTDSVSGAALAPTGMTIDPHTGKIIWDLYATPPPAGTIYPLYFPVTVKVSDSAGNTDYQSFILTVLD